MLAQETASAVMRRCRRAFPKSDRPAETQTQMAPITMNAMERMRKHRQFRERHPDPGGTLRGTQVYEEAKRVRAQWLERIGKEADQ